MNVRRGAVLLAVLLLAAVSACAEERAFTGYTIADSQLEMLAEGVRYSRYVLAPVDREAKYGQRINLIEVFPEALGTTRLIAAPGSAHIHKGLKSLTTILDAAQSGMEGTVLGGVNADFFDMTAGGSVGYLKTGREWLIAGEFRDGWAVGMTEEGTPVIGQPRTRIILTMPDGAETEIDALNGLRADTPRSDISPENMRAARKDNQLVLYTPAFGRKTYTPGGGTEAVIIPDGALTEGTLTARVERVYKRQKKEGTALKEGRMVLSGTGEADQLLRTLNQDDTVRITLTSQPPFDRTVIAAGGGRPDGGPLLIREGAPTDLEPMKAISVDVLYFYRRHPRTVFAIREDGGYFMLAVEGNNTGSWGMTLEETQTLLKDLGAYTALNLDGGPSTTMAVRLDGKIRLMTNTTGVRNRQTNVGSALILIEK